MISDFRHSEFRKFWPGIKRKRRTEGTKKEGKIGGRLDKNVEFQGYREFVERSD
jgi:hypothetical protein